MRRVQQETKPFGDHLTELRGRLFSTFLFFLAGSAAGYIIRERLIGLLVAPLGQTVFYTSPAGGFDFVLKVSLFFGLLVSIPAAVYHLLRFLEPVLPERSTKRLLVIMVVSVALVATGVLFAYYVSLPAALRFLATFVTGQIQALVSTDEYFSFVTRYLIGFGLIFQLPLILWIVNSVNPIPTGKLMRFQKWVILGSFIVAAILTPTPDVFNQLVMAVPPILLYQLTAAMLWVINRKARLAKR